MGAAVYVLIAPMMPRLEAQRGGIVLLASIFRFVLPVA